MTTLTLTTIDLLDEIDSYIEDSIYFLCFIFGRFREKVRDNTKTEIVKTFRVRVWDNLKKSFKNSE
jgi:hypothetical protein